MMNTSKYSSYIDANNIDNQYNEILEKIKSKRLIKTNKKIEYYNIAISFDIETTSFYYNDEKRAIMYIWAMCIDGLNIIGRTWEQFINIVNKISEKLCLSENRRLIIYIHNLSYEFQFMYTYFKWLKVFSLDTRKPVYALTNIGIEFRCSYILSGYNLDMLAKQIVNSNLNKLIGNLDYSKMRHSKTEMTLDELQYCINDVNIVVNYINSRIENDGDITVLPLTKTGYVRKHCKVNTMGRGKKQNNLYRKMVRSLTLEPKEYKQLKRAFQGGYTHSNPFYSGKVLDNVSSFDFTSSYPYVMVSEQFPMDKGEHVIINSMDEFLYNLKIYCCMFDVKFVNINSVVFYDSYISKSRTWGTLNATVNNGRIVRADELYTTLTEQDYFIISKMYTWEEMHISNFIRYKKQYLPTSFITSVLELYRDKTILKGIEGEEYNYLKSKEMLNSTYGMIVTDICRDEIIFYDNNWNVEPVNIDDAISKYNKSKSRFLFYPWGVWVTAYARKNLFTGIFACNIDYVYSDTDSIKILNVDKHLEYIEKYNENVKKKLYKAMKYHGLDIKAVKPKNKKGNEKLLGIWEYEGTYDKFKTLGAKRYFTFDGNDYHLTVAGLSKKNGLEYILSQEIDPFTFFNDDMYIPSGHTGKMTHTYIDNHIEGLLTDYNGIVSEYSENSYIHLEPSDYSLSIGEEYARYILGIREGEY